MSAISTKIYAKDSSGTLRELQPETTISNVDGLQAALNAKADSTTVSSLSNLEADDRNALVDVVDSGRKNLVNIPDQTSQGTGYHFVYEFNLPAGDYVVLCTATSTNQIAVTIGYDSTSKSSYSTGENKRHVIEITATTAVTSFKVWISSDTVSIKDVMICKKAEYKISPKIVPYINTYEGNYIITSGSLNDIKESCFAAYSPDVTDSPVSNEWFFCRTSYISKDSALQEVILLKTDFQIYVRTKTNGTWRAWKQISLS